MNTHRLTATHTNRKKVKKATVKERIKAGRKRETLYGLSVVLVIIASAIIGGWYVLQPRGQEPSKVLAANFSLIDLNGNSFSLSDFKGKVVVIDFMATWCGPCREEMPHYGVIWGKYQGKMVLMSIDIDPRESEETLGTFAQEFPYATWIWARDTANLGQVYQVTAIPKTVIIDQDGYIRFVHVGVTDSSTFIQEIDQLLSERR